MDKRGMISKQLLWGFYLIINIAIGALLFMFVSNSFSGESFDNQFYAKDIGLLIDSLYGFDGNIEITYNFKNEIKFELIGNEIKICSLDNLDDCYYYEFVKSDVYDVKEVSFTAQRIKLEKIG